MAEFGDGFGPVRVAEHEAGGEESVGDDAAALEDELGYGAQEDRADFHHPGGGGEADRCSRGAVGSSGDDERSIETVGWAKPKAGAPGCGGWILIALWLDAELALWR